ncbi:sulfatase-modifying factor enzyme 1 [Neolewinella xylanilytica]|uniref:Sulfatase-modifying factor enzyme 1 n=1 Tax=Neolewinella xylanilytica TaxID=1514080 RepID=A0A2S6I9M8_9BACT|nr:SUMF1/EgtB/PvdO family nonheme iron enzyme [Neolewinella xylanilytica]PPK88204.1 sulfatase-modifying factor enzyme 1 [Neolewinella xylanilytica]
MKRPFCLFVLWWYTITLSANNIFVDNLAVYDNLGDPGFATVKFDLRWENSWRVTTAPGNYDAAWVFAKYRVGGGEWRHVRFSAATAIPSGASVDVFDDVGVMVYASGEMTGPADYPGIELGWDLGVDAIAWSTDIEIRVFAIEMTYVPAGAFYLGTGLTNGSEVDEFYQANNGKPYHVRNAGEIIVSSKGNRLWYTDVGNRGADFGGPIPADYPNGYDAFYLMKYETSQQQWVDFFNTLSPAHRLLHDVTAADGKDSDTEHFHNGVVYDPASGADAYTTLPETAAGYTSMLDMMAYFDWSGLRPLTELEFEKAARGPLYPMGDEFAWGNPNVANARYAILNFGLPNEKVAAYTLTKLGVNGNATYLDTNPSDRAEKGPLRCGVYAGSVSEISASDRVSAGAGYYGNMELSGNQWEGVVTIVDDTGRAFTNTHGDGSLSADGFANVPTWPTDVDGVGIRGGRSDNAQGLMRISDRSYSKVVTSNNASRYYWLQWRGVRGL